MDSYELQCWQRALWASWTARKMTKWVPGQIKPESSQEAKMATQRRSHSGHILSGGGSLEETIMLGKLAGSRRRGGPAMRWCSDSIREASGVSLRELSGAAEDMRPGHRGCHSFTWVAISWEWTQWHVNHIIFSTIKDSDPAPQFTQTPTFTSESNECRRARMWTRSSSLHFLDLGWWHEQVLNKWQLLYLGRLLPLPAIWEFPVNSTHSDTGGQYCSNEQTSSQHQDINSVSKSIDTSPRKALNRVPCSQAWQRKQNKLLFRALKLASAGPRQACGSVRNRGK